MATDPCFMVTLTVTLMFMVASPTVTARPLMKPTMGAPSPSISLVYHLRLGEETGYRWASLMQLRHCSGEPIMLLTVRLIKT
ncbi:unnamed protein product [Brassica oleracea]